MMINSSSFISNQINSIGVWGVCGTMASVSS
jgi:hypothetical protein